jgi:hypothetical protein
MRITPQNLVDCNRAPFFPLSPVPAESILLAQEAVFAVIGA